MLILTRKIGEEIRISDDIVIKVIRLQGNQVSIGIVAPKSVPVHREEIYARIFPTSPNRYIATSSQEKGVGALNVGVAL